jgi:hypothetical protein
MSFDLTNLLMLIVRAHARHGMPIGKVMRVALQAAASGKFPIHKSNGDELKLSPTECNWLLNLAANAEQQNDVRWWTKAPWSALQAVLVSEPKYWFWFDSDSTSRGKHNVVNVDTNLSKAISHRMKMEQPGSTIQWKKFCDLVRDDCSGWKDRTKGIPKRGFSNKTIQRMVKRLRNGQIGQVRQS